MNRKEYMRKYRKDHPRSPEELRITERKYMHNLRLRIFHLLRDECIHCSFSDWRALQIDHIHGNGYKERKQFPSTKMFYLHVLSQIKAGSKDYQLLCANCNWIKRYENEEHKPRKTERR
jgi:hypothetical protein